MDTTYNSSITPSQFFKSVVFKSRKAFPGWMRVASFLVVVVQYAAFGYLLSLALMATRGVPPKAVLAGAIVAMAATALSTALNHYAMSTAVRRSNYMAGRPSELTAGGEGITYRSAVATNHHPWSAIAGVEEHGGIVYLSLDNFHYYPLPYEAFPSVEQRQAFIDLVRARTGASR